MPALRRCPGCLLTAPRTDRPAEGSTGASPECWSVYLEVAAFEAEQPTLLAGHQRLVDAYGAQHAQPGSIRLPYSLVGLHLALEHGWSGLAVRALHGRMGKPRPDWPVLERPVTPGDRTIRDVAEAGARVGSVPGHHQALHDWSASVWTAWSRSHEAVRALAEHLLTH